MSRDGSIDTSDDQSYQFQLSQHNDLLCQYLQLSQSCLMFTDADFVIRLVNPAVNRLLTASKEDFLRHFPFFDSDKLVGLSIDVFHAKPGVIREHLIHLTGNWSSNLYIGRLIFKIIITPLDDHGTRIGYVVEWREQSEEILLIGQIEEFIHVIKHRNRPDRIGGNPVNGHYLVGNDQQTDSVATMLDNQFTVKQGLESILDHLKESTLEEIQAERLNTIGFMAAGVAHEINNPISGVLANMMYLKALCVGDQLHEVIDENIDELTRIAKIVQGLLGFSRSNKVSCYPVQLGSAIDDVMQLVNLQLKSINFLDKEKVKVSSHIPCPVHLLMPVISENNFIQILLNLVMNAVYALHEARTPSPSVEIHANISSDEHFVEISVTDNGPGIPEPIKDKIFMPFFTTKDQGQGTGMGLALSLNMAKECQGMVYLDENYTQGSRFVLKIPIETKNDYFDLECFSVIKSILEEDFPAVIQSFIHLSNKDLGYIKRSFGKQDFKLLHQDVHRLKGMSISICAKLVQHSCQRILDLIETADEQGIQAEILELEQTLIKTIAKLR